MILQVTGIVFLHDDCAQALKHVGDTRLLYVYSR